MQHYFNALWQGILGGSAVRDRASDSGPDAHGFTSSFAQGLYWFGFEVANVVVQGARA